MQQAILLFILQQQQQCLHRNSIRVARFATSNITLYFTTARRMLTSHQHFNWSLCDSDSADNFATPTVFAYLQHHQNFLLCNNDITANLATVTEFNPIASQRDNIATAVALCTSLQQ
jgi:hypothetical protein